MPVEMAHRAVKIRGLSLFTLVVAAALLVLREAAPILVPVLVSVLLAYPLEPIVAAMTRRRVPRPIAAVLVYLVLGAVGTIVARGLRNQVGDFIQDLPKTMAALQRSVARDDRAPSNPIDRLREAANAIDQARAAAAPAPDAGVSRVAIVRRSLDVRAYLMTVTLGVLATGLQVFTVGLLTFLLLATGDLYKRKLVKLAGPAPADRKATLDLMNGIDRQIERYLLVRVLICGIVAAATGLSLSWLGVNDAVVWGLIAGVLNVLPFIGPTAGVVLIALAAFLQFKTLAMTGAAGSAALVVAAVEGNVVTPLLMSRAGELNTVAVFVSVLVWGRLWDVWRLLLAVPIMVAVKAAADHIESLKPVGELLGR